LIAVVSTFSIWVWVSWYLDHTQEVPAFGGEYSEGVIGAPVNINPLVPVTDVDRDLNSLIFSGLTKIDADGQLAGDLAKSWEVSEDGLTYVFTLRSDVIWQDGESFNAHDVAFTYNLILQDQYPGPYTLKKNWEGIQVEVIDDQQIKLVLPDAYAAFLENTTLGIVPEHLLIDTPVAELADAPFNRNPVGTGPYRFSEIVSKDDVIKTVVLTANMKYYGKVPYIETVRFKLYNNTYELLAALRNHEINGVYNVAPEILADVADMRSINVYANALPRYQGIFFNTRDRDMFIDIKVRSALSYAIDRQKLIAEVFDGAAQEATGPLPAASWAYKPLEAETITFDAEKARALLAEAGWTDADQNGILERNGQELTITLLSDDDDQRVQMAILIEAMWEEIGVNVEVRLFGVGTFIDEYLRKRDYDCVLFGQSLSWDPDVYAFWHSTQRDDPGLNISLYYNERVDKLLEDARRITKPEQRKKKYYEFQTIVRAESPAIFLVTPVYNYAVSDSVKNVNSVFMVHPADRLKDLPTWYVKTKRVEIVPEKPAVVPDLSTEAGG